MSLQDAVTKVVAVLRDLEIPYVLVGAFSSNAHGIPRSTQSIRRRCRFASTCSN